MREDAALFVDAIGSRIAKAGQMGILQGLGADAKLQKGVETALAKDFIDTQLPILGVAEGILNEVFGGGINIKQYLEKNPRALPYILKLAGNFMGGAGIQGLKGLGVNIPMGNMRNNGQRLSAYG